METISYKSIWISDFHLGTRGCSAAELLQLLNHTKADQMFLVGDIVDMWQLSKKWYWPVGHNAVVQKILHKSRSGTEVIYIPGNHDESVRNFLPVMLGGIQVVKEYEYQAVCGKKFLVTHGDLYDIITTYHAWLARLGDWAYVSLIELNRYMNWMRRKLRMGYWSLSKYVKTKVKNAASFIGKFEESLAEACRLRGFDGIIAGHIHHAEIRDIGGIMYMNDGDFVESRTALAEQHDGTFKIIEWREKNLLEIAEWKPGSQPVVHLTPQRLLSVK